MKENWLFLGLNRQELVNHSHMQQRRCQVLFWQGWCCEKSWRGRFIQVQCWQTYSCWNSWDMSFSLVPPLTRQITICTWGRKHRPSLSFPKKSLRKPQSWIFNFNRHQARHAQGWGSAAYKVGSFALRKVQNLAALTASAGMGCSRSCSCSRTRTANTPAGNLHPRKEDWHQKGIAENEKIIFPTASYSYSIAGSFCNYDSWFFLSAARCFISIKLLSSFLYLLRHITPLYWLFRSNLQVKNWPPG